MPEQPMFSIITVCLNAGNGLNLSIKSVLKQTFQDYEIIVKDGYSTDGSYEQVPNDKRIVKVQKKDFGIYDAMNQALDYARGKYVLMLNAADLFYDETVLHSFYNLIVSNDYPELVYCDYMTTGLGVYVQSPPKLTNRFLFRTMLCHQVCMIKRECYDRLNGFDTNLKVLADWDFLVRLSMLSGFKYKHIQKLGIIYSSGGFSHQNKQLAIKEGKIVRKRHFSDSYYLYNFFRLITLPGFRKIIASGGGFVSKLYQRVANVLNRLF